MICDNNEREYLFGFQNQISESDVNFYSINIQSQYYMSLSSHWEPQQLEFFEIVNSW